MSLEITTLKDQADSSGTWIADRRIWLTADKSKAVEDGDPASAFLLVAPGQGMARARAERLGVIPPQTVPVVATPEPEPDMKEKSKPEDKQRAKPKTKSLKKAKTKKK